MKENEREGVKDYRKQDGMGREEEREGVKEKRKADGKRKG